jgi:predicted nuclease of predicted toxin-antitoxin system
LKFKIDENLPAECALLFREAGYDADTVAEEKLSGAEDSILLGRCQSENQILVTLDLDFSNIRAYPPKSHSGIVVLRPNSQHKPGLLFL